LRWLFETPYQSSNATIEDTSITLSRATARWNRRRTSACVPLINAMHALVSSRYVVIEDVSPWRGGLLPSFWHEGLGGQPIELGEPLRDVREHRLHQDATANAANPDPVALEPELARQPNCLTSPISEKLGGGRHRASS
jgi:hypothetical protein